MTEEQDPRMATPGLAGAAPTDPNAVIPPEMLAQEKALISKIPGWKTVK